MGPTYPLGLSLPLTHASVLLLLLLLFCRLLWDRIADSHVRLDDQDICPCIYSLQSLSGNMPIVRVFIKYLTEAVDQSHDPFPSKVIDPPLPPPPPLHLLAYLCMYL